MNTDEARHVLTTYAAYHSQRDEAIHTLKRANVTIADIVRLSGLSREGIRKILDRQETPMLTVYVVTAGEYDDYSIESVHATPESAAKAVDAIKTSGRPSDIRDSATYQPWDVQA